MMPKISPLVEMTKRLFEATENEILKRYALQTL